jgi:hypothetical protein
MAYLLLYLILSASPMSFLSGSSKYGSVSKLMSLKKPKSWSPMIF